MLGQMSLWNRSWCLCDYLFWVHSHKQNFWVKANTHFMFWYLVSSGEIVQNNVTISSAQECLFLSLNIKKYFTVCLPMWKKKIFQCCFIFMYLDVSLKILLYAFTNVFPYINCLYLKFDHSSIGMNFCLYYLKIMLLLSWLFTSFKYQSFFF